MNAKVVPLICAKSAVPLPEETSSATRDREYILDLEHENLDLRNAIADLVLARRYAQGATARWPTVVLLSAAFLLGWLLDPPARLWGDSAHHAGHHFTYGPAQRDDGHRG